MSVNPRKQAVKRVRFLSALIRYSIALLSLILGLAWSGAMLAQARMTVIGVTVQKTTVTPQLRFAQAAITLSAGDTLANPARSDQSGSKGAISYRSSNTAIARVSNDGQVVAVAMGSATITAMQEADLPAYEAGMASYEITVVGPLLASAAFASRTWLINEPVGDGVIPVTASGGMGTLRYAIAPALPMGLDLAADTGMLSGRAGVESAPAIYTVTVSDSAKPPHTATATFSLGVAPALRLAVDRPKWTALVGDAVNETPVVASGGVGALHYAVSPALPASLTLDAASGAIAGTVTAESALTDYLVTVTDSAVPAHVVTAGFSLLINDGLTATSAIADHTAAVGDVVHYRPVTSAGGVGALRYRVAPALPAGLDMAADSGVISGNAAAASLSTAYTVTVSDSAFPAHSATARFTLAINDTFAATVAVPAHTVVVGDTVNLIPVTVLGGVGARHFSVAPALPAGLQMDAASGAVSGQAGIESAAADYRVTVTDSATPNAHSTSATFSLTVQAALRTSVPNSGEIHRVGDAVSYTPTLIWGGVRPYRYTVSPALPAGLILDTATGAITGAATVASPYTSYTYTVTDSATPAHSATGKFTLTFEPALTATAVSTTIHVAVGDAVSEAPVTAAGGLGWHRYTVSPALPGSLVMDAASGTIRGTADIVSAATVYTVTVTDSATPKHSASATFSLTVDSALQTSALNASETHRVGDAVSYTPALTRGGVPPYQYTVSPRLPAGLTLDAANGAITGAATVASSYTSYTYTVTDSATPAHSATGQFALTFEPALTATVAVATIHVAVGDAVSETPVTATGGLGSYHYTVSSALPGNLTLDAASGTITGTAAAASVLTNYTVTVTDSIAPAHAVTANFSLLISDGLTATAAIETIHKAVGDTVNATPVTAAGGVGPYRYTVSPALPGNLTLDAASGAIAGTADTVSAAAAYTVTVTDSAVPAHSAAADFTLTVSPALSSTSLVGARNFRLSDNVTITPMAARGGVGQLHYSVVPSLPTGIALNDVTGVITAIPTVRSVKTSYTITATDTGMPAHSVSQTIDIAVFDVISTFRNPGSSFTGTCSAASGWNVRAHVEAPGVQRMTLIAGLNGDNAIAYNTTSTDADGNLTWTGTAEQVRDGFKRWGAMFIGVDVLSPDGRYHSSGRSIRCTP